MNLKGRFPRKDKKRHKTNKVYSIMLKIRNANNIVNHIKRHPEDQDNMIGRLIELMVGVICDVSLRECELFQSSLSVGGVVSDGPKISPYINNQEKIL